MVRGSVAAGGSEANSAGVVSWVGSGCEAVRRGGCGRGWEFVRGAGGTGSETVRTGDGGAVVGMD